ncbi:MAG: 50S ribosomal protein L40e [Candidatus Nanoarchaeia archaeon]|nr:50S ribosomal protein L40e [Candidatus Nanoarchaeia archaeon]
MSQRFKEADDRLFKNVFVCGKCGQKRRANPAKVKLGAILCRRCGYSHLRPKKKERVKG